MPVQARIVIPFAFLRELPAHEEQLLAWLGVLKGVIGAQIGEFLPAIPRHPAEQGTFAVNHLVVGQRQNEILVEGVEQAEGQPVVVIFAMDRLLRHVIQRVVHPAEIPFVAEPQAAEIGRPRDHRPRRRFLRHRDRFRTVGVDQFVHAAQKVDGLQILDAAMDVGNPLAFLAAVVAIKHRGDGIDA